MLVVGLTGSMGMGKSTAAKHFLERGVPVFDADAEVHRLYGGAAAPLIEAAFPGTVVDGQVDRERLTAAVVGDHAAISRLEAIVHPLVRDAERTFIRQHHEAGADLVVLDIPLLFETAADGRVDVTVVVSAPPDVQRARVLSRTGMTAEKFDGLRAQQMPDSDKRERANFVVDTSGPVEETGRELDRIIEILRRVEGRASVQRDADRKDMP